MTARTPIYASSAAFGCRTIEDVLDIASEWGVSNIEITAGLRRDEQLADKVAKAQDFEILFHNYAPAPPAPFVLNLASEDGATKAMSLDHCKAAIDLSRRIGARWYSVHAGYAAVVRPEHLGKAIPSECRKDKGIALSIFHDSIRELSSYANSRDVSLLVENNVVAEQNLVDGRNEMLLVATASEIQAFAEEFHKADVGILIDLAHVKVTCNTLGLPMDEFLVSVAPWTRALHVSDNDGVRDTNQPFGRGSWIERALQPFSPEYIVVEAYRIKKADFDNCRDALEASLAA